MENRGNSPIPSPSAFALTNFSNKGYCLGESVNRGVLAFTASGWKRSEAYCALLPRYMFDVSNKKGFNDVYGFIDPSMTHERNKFDDIQTYITTCFGMGKEIYFLPYIVGFLATYMMLSGRSTTTAKKLAWVVLKVLNLAKFGGESWLSWCFVTRFGKFS
ncbi:hypothetical protein LR48_Vigan237s000100 [Vigna angularis]|uniref:Uncharacterized protein n=1 Tax=Phaseolus angularis TaxID=3914 RepID=A0A0L9T6F6_PHAAN|nr:hypothetical protein LR48_Vigan237s000100 [Vigna angularis]